MGTAWSEPTLIRLASGFEHVAQARLVPRFLSTLPTPVPARPVPYFEKGSLLSDMKRPTRKAVVDLLRQLPRPRFL